jgi:hypothetical protein
MVILGEKLGGGPTDRSTCVLEIVSCRAENGTEIFYRYLFSGKLEIR